MQNREGPEPEVVDSYVFGQVNHERRQRAIEDSKEIDYAEDAKAQVAQLKLHAHPLPPIPRDLIDIISVVIPGEADNEESVNGGNIAKLTGPVWRAYRDKASPCLVRADVAKLQESRDTLMVYWGYTVAYLGYASHQEAYWRAHAMTIQARLDHLRTQFTLHYGQATDRNGNALKATTVKLFVKSDPAIRELVDQANKAEVVVKYLAAHVRALESVEKLCSRLLTKNIKDHSGSGHAYDPQESLREMQRRLRGSG